VVAWNRLCSGFHFDSFLHIVMGELAPKSIAIRKTESVAMSPALPL
jgi:CBS domain containing-hemolysin-like protein